MAGRKSDFTLPTLDDLFSTQELRDDAKLSKIRDIPLELIDDFPDHPFKVRDDEDMIQLVESVKERGVISHDGFRFHYLDNRVSLSKGQLFRRDKRTFCIGVEHINGGGRRVMLLRMANALPAPWFPPRRKHPSSPNLSAGSTISARTARSVKASSTPVLISLRRTSRRKTTTVCR